MGYAVVTDQDILESNRLPGHLSAQAPELFASWEKEKKVTIYTDSRYAFGVVHDLGTLWRMRGSLTSTGKQIAHASLVSNLLESILLPKGNRCL